MTDLADAQAVADKIGIKLHTANFAMEYWDNVFEHFWQNTKQDARQTLISYATKKLNLKPFGLCVWATIWTWGGFYRYRTLRTPWF